MDGKGASSTTSCGGGAPRLSRSASAVDPGRANNSSTRWKPTPEQKEILENYYANGVRSPAIEAIDGITKELKRFGRVEGKNIFYWFQNYKAREKRKSKEQQSERKPSKWPSLGSWTSLFRSKRSADNHPREEEEVDSEIARRSNAQLRRNLSVDMRRTSCVELSDSRSLQELFPLRPDQSR